MPATVSVHVGSLTPVWPNALTTGVPPGTVLTNHVGDITLSTPQVLQNMHIQGEISVNVPGCTIKNCLIDNWGTFAIVTNAGAETGTPLLIQDCEIGPPSFTDPSDPNHADGATQILSKNFTALRLNMHGSENGFSIDANASVLSCYVHDMNMKGADPHTDCIQRQHFAPYRT